MHDMDDERPSAGNSQTKSLECGQALEDRREPGFGNRLYDTGLQKISRLQPQVLPDCFQAPGGHIEGFPCIDGQLCNLLCLYKTADTPVSMQHMMHPAHCMSCGSDKPVLDSAITRSFLVPGIPFQNGLMWKTGFSGFSASSVKQRVR